MQTQHKLLCGSDIELMPAGIRTNQDDLSWWHGWLRCLRTLPPKGERCDLGDGYWAHRDGLSLEYGIPPVGNEDEFVAAIREGKRRAAVAVRTALCAVDWFSIQAVAEASGVADYLDLGCSPDMVVVGKDDYRIRDVPSEVRSEQTRECGGHIHVSLPEPFLKSDELRATFVAQLDDVLYPMVNRNLTDYRSWYRHRKLFRLTPYGVEYRSLGASALFSKNTEQCVKALFDLVRSTWEV